MSIIAHNEDIINNSGITLANPTGAAGTYTLAFKNTQYQYFIDGTLFTGTVVRVGAGLDFPTINQAISGTTGNIIISLTSGTYMGGTSPVASIPVYVGPEHTGRKIYIKSWNGDPTNSLIRPATLTTKLCSIFSNVELLIEGVKLQSDEIISPVNISASGCTPSIALNKCIVDFSEVTTTYGQGAFGVQQSSNTIFQSINLKHCTMNVGLCLVGSFAGYYDLQRMRIDKCILNTVATLRTTGTFALDDHVTSAAAGYGSGYGEDRITRVAVKSTLSWGAGAATEFTADGTYTLAAGANTVEATVDYSELASADASDAVRVEILPRDLYWVDDSGNSSDRAHWATVSAGPGGNAAPDAVDTAVFDSNSFTAPGQNVFVTTPFLCTQINIAGAKKFNLFIQTGGSLSPQNDLSGLLGLFVEGTGTFITNNCDISVSKDFCVEATASANLGSSTINIDGVDASETVLRLKGTITMNSPDISFTAISSHVRAHFEAESQAFGAVEITMGNNANLTIDQSSTFQELSIRKNGEVCFADSSVQTVLSAFSLAGDTPRGLSLIGDQPWTVSKATGTVNAINCTIKNSTATGGATFNSFFTNGCHDGLGNTGWNFGNPAPTPLRHCPACSAIFLEDPSLYEDPGTCPQCGNNLN